MKPPKSITASSQTKKPQKQTNKQTHLNKIAHTKTGLLQNTNVCDVRLEELHSIQYDKEILQKGYQASMLLSPTDSSFPEQL